MKLYSPAAIREIEERHEFKTSKSLGQNFLTDKNIIDKIVQGALISQDDLVVEIGPGLGTLTEEAAKYASKVIAIEIDKKLLPILKETLGGYDNVEVINKDILKTDLTEIIEREKEQCAGEIKGIKIIGNLPYYITTPIIMKILEDRIAADSITIMMQKEVADRIKADPGSRTYGALSVAVQYYCEVTQIAAVSKESFVPKPKVDSSVLRMDIRKQKPVDLKDESLFFQCIKFGFGKRRKTLFNSLTGINGNTKEKTGRILEKAKIDAQRRAETLTLEEFASIANVMAEETALNG